MKLSNTQELSNKILDDEAQRYGEIYRIRNLTTKKCYIGQAVSHILNHKRYRPYGKDGRFRCHISEAYSNKKCQSKYLNNAIKKYGVDDFTVELIEICDIKDMDEREIYHISCEKTVFPSGYNLTFGGQSHKHTLISKQRVSDGVQEYYKSRKFDKFMVLSQDDIDINAIENYIKPLRRENKQFGWYVYIKRKKCDFGGVHITLEDSYNNARTFIIELHKRLAKHLDAGNSLESQTTTPTLETEMEELG
jgi:group I intron endonuclease